MAFTIPGLNLHEAAAGAAQEIQNECPWVVFTSGTRNLWGQAHAMAVDHVQDPSFIARTYKHAGPFLDWLERHPVARQVDQIATGFYQDVLLKMGPEELDLVSRHLHQDAFDVLPLLDPDGAVTEQGQRLMAICDRVCRAHGGIFLSHEGNLIRWHCQIPATAPVAV